MTAQPTHPFEPVEDEASMPWARAMRQGHIDVLGELIDMGMTLSRAIIRQATEADAAPVFQGNLDLAFSRVTLAVRRTVALRERLMTDLEAWEATAARGALQAEWDQDCLDEAAETVSRERVKRIVKRAIETDRQGDWDTKRLCEDAEERLEDSDIYGDMADRPFSEIVAQICQDLGVTPDWSRMAQEAWAREEMEHGPIGAPLARWVAARDAGDPGAPNPSPLAGEGGAQAPEPWRRRLGG
jgi:hypothetical protein